MEEQVACIRVWRVRQHTGARSHTRGRPKGEGPSARGLLRAPVAHRRVVDTAEAARADHVVLEPIVRRGVAHVARRAVRVVAHRAEPVKARRRPHRPVAPDHVPVPRRGLDPMWQVRVPRPRRPATVELQPRDLVHLASNAGPVDIPPRGPAAGDLATRKRTRPKSVRTPPASVRKLALLRVVPREGRTPVIGRARRAASAGIRCAAEVEGLSRSIEECARVGKDLPAARRPDIIGLPLRLDPDASTQHGSLAGVRKDREARVLRPQQHGPIAQVVCPLAQDNGPPPGADRAAHRRGQASQRGLPRALRGIVAMDRINEDGTVEGDGWGS
mmetsp:Transcript_77388/g.224549  ORF Transcript_77388/g.224549 Transcript_77388/m.224549 type:complete len:330 (-) Transcript_77388:275-1264(-)